MWRSIGLVGIGILAVLAMGQAGDVAGGRAAPYFRASPPVPWTEIGSLTSSVTYPSVDERDCTTCDANTAILVWKVPAGATQCFLKFETDADADSTVLAMMVAAGKSGKQVAVNGSLETDDYMYGGQVALTGGTQVARHSNVYVDTVVVTDGLLDMTATDSAANRVCVVDFDSWGYKQIAFVATTLQASSTLRVYARWQ